MATEDSKSRDELAKAIDASLSRLRQAIELASSELAPRAAEQLHCSASRSISAMKRLRAKIDRDIGLDVDEAQTNACFKFPTLGEASARWMLNELDEIIREVERNVLVPAEARLSGKELDDIKRLVGQVWGWMVCDLQDPLWQQYPDATPSER